MMKGYGAYGKMPALGDFFRLGLPPSFLDPWDNWLQKGLTDVRQKLGGRWQECFMRAPIWRFTLAAGVAGPHAVLGVLMPSVDRVGRQFPLTLAALLPPVLDVPFVHFSAKEQFEHLETIALGSLEDGFSKEMLSHRLVKVSNPVVSVAQSLQNHGSCLTLLASDPIISLAAQAMQQGSRKAVWSAVLEGSAPMMATQALPAADQMCGLFDLTASVWGNPQNEQRGAV